MSAANVAIRPDFNPHLASPTAEIHVVRLLLILSFDQVFTPPKPRELHLLKNAPLNENTAGSNGIDLSNPFEPLADPAGSFFDNDIQIGRQVSGILLIGRVTPRSDFLPHIQELDDRIFWDVNVVITEKQVGAVGVIQEICNSHVAARCHAVFVFLDYRRNACSPGS